MSIVVLEPEVKACEIMNSLGEMQQQEDHGMEW
jgi:hypothetical protein